MMPSLDFLCSSICVLSLFLLSKCVKISLLFQVAFKTFATKKSNYSSCWTCEEYHYFRKSRHHLGCSSSPYIYCHNRFNEITQISYLRLCVHSVKTLQTLSKSKAWQNSALEKVSMKDKTSEITCHWSF